MQWRRCLRNPFISVEAARRETADDLATDRSCSATTRFDTRSHALFGCVAGMVGDDFGHFGEHFRPISNVPKLQQTLGSKPARLLQSEHAHGKVEPLPNNVELRGLSLYLREGCFCMQASLFGPITVLIVLAPLVMLCEVTPKLLKRIKRPREQLSIVVDEMA